MRIAIQPDHLVHANGERQSFSERWIELARERGIETSTVDADAEWFFDELRRCDGFMWRFGYDPHSIQFAQWVLSAVDHGLGIPVFPSWNSRWHFEDKIAQHYLLAAAGVRTPRTWLFWNTKTALEFCRTASYPLVVKLARGFQASNVRLLHGFDEAVDVIRQVFGGGLVTLQQQPSAVKRVLRHRLQALRLLFGKPLPAGIQHGYLYLQEFLPGNEFDTRVTVIGERAFAFRRFNRPDDFRASGSGRIDWDPAKIDHATVRLAFDVAARLGTQSVAIDGLRRGAVPVVGEISYTYAAWAIRDCPGHWVSDARSEGTGLRWIEGTLRAEDAIFEDFVRLCQRRSGIRRTPNPLIARSSITQ